MSTLHFVYILDKTVVMYMLNLQGCMYHHTSKIPLSFITVSINTMVFFIFTFISVRDNCCDRRLLYILKKKDSTIQLNFR